MATAQKTQQNQARDIENHAPNIEIGINATDRKAVAEGLATLLADTYTLYLKTQNFHWNVTGPQFRALHAMFEEQYKELAAAVDEVAERIRALGQPAPGTFRAFLQLTSIEEDAGIPSADAMTRQLAIGHEAVDRTARNVFALAEEAEDQVTMDLLVERMQIHEKAAWMLRSLLE